MASRSFSEAGPCRMENSVGGVGGLGEFGEGNEGMGGFLEHKGSSGCRAGLKPECTGCEAGWGRSLSVTYRVPELAFVDLVSVRGPQQPPFRTLTSKPCGLVRMGHAGKEPKARESKAPVPAQYQPETAPSQAWRPCEAGASPSGLLLPGR